MGGVLSTLVDLAKQNAQGIAKSIEPLARQTAKDLTTAGASQIDKTLIGLENGARTKSMTRGDLDAAMNTTQLGMPIVKKMLPTALKLAAKNNHSSKELPDGANDLIQTSDKFMKEYQEMRAQEDYQGTDAFDKMKDQVLEKKEQGQALEQFLQVTEKWEALKSKMNQQCGLNLNVGATSGLTSNYNRFAGLAIPK